MIIATNGPANKAYRRRWYIEYLSGDGKTRDLNMEDSHLTRPAKFITLLVVITLARAWTYASVTTTEGTRAIKHKPDRAAETWRRPWPKRNGAF